MVKNEHSVNEWMNFADFLRANTYLIKKAKSYFNSYWVGMVKNGCVPLGHGAL